MASHAEVAKIRSVAGRSECTEQPRDVEDGFLKVAVAGIRCGGIVAAARFGIEQDGSDHCLHVAAHARAIVLENFGHALDISGTWITGHKMLNQLARNKRRKIWMIENVVNRAVEILRS